MIKFIQFVILHILFHFVLNPFKKNISKFNYIDFFILFQFIEEKKLLLILQVSRVRIPVTREDHGTEVRCEVRHEALPEDKILMEAASLNIHCKFFLRFKQG